MAAYIPQIYRRFSTPLTLDLGPSSKVIDETRALSEAIKTRTDVLLPEVSKAINQAKAELGQVIQAAKSETLTRIDERCKAVEDKVLQDMPQKLAEKLPDVNRHTSEELGKLQIEVLTQLKSHVSAAANDVVTKLRAAAPPAALVIAPGAWPLLIPLVQAMTLALDQTPEAVYAGKDPLYKGLLANDVQLDQLRNALPQAGLNALENAPNDLKARFLNAFERFLDADKAKRSQRLAAMVGLLHEVAAFLK
jgi:hypothetical protein